MANNNNHYQNSTSTSTSSSASAADGISRLNSPRFMTRRAQSFKRNNPPNHHEIDVLNSPRSELTEGFDSLSEKKQQQTTPRLTQRLQTKRSGGHEKKKKKKLVVGQWMFFLFCGFCLFLGIVKVSVNGWFGSAIERIGAFDQDYWDSSSSLKNPRDHISHNNRYQDVEETDVKQTLVMVASGIVTGQDHKDDVYGLNQVVVTTLSALTAQKVIRS